MACTMKQYGRQPIWALVFLLSTQFFAGCATAAEGGSRNLLTAADLAGVDAPNLYLAIEELRPLFLDPYAAGFPQQMAVNARRGHTEVVVYLDGEEVGTPEVLRGLSTSDVLSVRFLNAQQATTRFGNPHSRGALLVTIAP